MTESILPTAPSPGRDNPLRRLPGVLSTALLIWALLIWGLGCLLRQSTVVIPMPEAVDAQLVELQDPPKPVVAETQKPEPQLARQPVAPPRAPRRIVKAKPARKRPLRAHHRPRSVSRAAAPPTTPVSLPATTLADSKSKALAGAGEPDFQKGPGVSLSGSGDGVTRPGVSGAAYLKNPKPRYPIQARRKRMEGTVLLHVFVSRKGRTLKIEVAKSSGYAILDEAAAAAVRKWRFIPPHRGNATLAKWVLVPIAFRLRN